MRALTFVLSFLLVFPIFSQEKQLRKAVNSGPSTNGIYTAYFKNFHAREEFKVKSWLDDNDYVIIDKKYSSKERFGGNTIRYIDKVTFESYDGYLWKRTKNSSLSVDYDKYLSKCKSCVKKQEAINALINHSVLIRDMYHYSDKYPYLQKQFADRAYFAAVESPHLSRWESFIKFFPMDSRTEEINLKIDAYKVEQKRIAKEKAMAARKKEEEERIARIKREEVERIRREDAEKNRIQSILRMDIGDRICYSQDWIHTDPGFLGFGASKTNYKMYITFYIENVRRGDDLEDYRYQLRAGQISSSHEDRYSYPKIDGIQIKKGDIFWCNPYMDSSWYSCY